MKNTTTATTETQTQGQGLESSEIKVREIVRDEIAICLKSVVENQDAMSENQKKMGEDMLEIKVALLGSGNKYKTDKGLAEMIRISYEYSQANIQNKVIERATPAIEMFEDWKENGNWEMLKKIILNNIISDKMKLFFGIGSWAGIMAFISSLIVFIGWLEGWFSK